MTKYNLGKVTLTEEKMKLLKDILLEKGINIDDNTGEYGVLIKLFDIYHFSGINDYNALETLIKSDDFIYFISSFIEILESPNSRQIDFKYNKDYSVKDSKKSYFHPGVCDLRGMDSAKGLVLSPDFYGDMILSDLESLEGLVLLNNHRGDIYLEDDLETKLRKIENYEFPDNLDGDLVMNAVTSAINVVFPKTISGSMYCRYLDVVENVSFPEVINGSLWFWRMSSINNIKRFPKQINGDFIWHGDFPVDDFTMPEYVGGDLDFKELTRAGTLKLPKGCRGIINLQALEYVDNLIFPNELDAIVQLDSLTSLIGVKFPKTGNCKFRYMGNEYFSLSDMKKIQQHEINSYGKKEYKSEVLNIGDDKEKSYFKFFNLDNNCPPKDISGDLVWRGSENAVDVTLDSNVSGSLYFENIRNIYNMRLLGKVGYFICLNNVVDVSNLVFPSHYDGRILLDSLTSLRGIVFPETGNCKVRCNKYCLNTYFSLSAIKKLQEHERNIYDVNGIKEEHKNDVLLYDDMSDKFNIFSLNDVTSEEKIVGDLTWVGDEMAINVSVPSNILAHLRFVKLRAAYGLDLSGGNKNIDKKEYRVFNLNNLIYAEGVIFPSYLYGYVDIGSLNNLNGIVLPEEGECEFYYKGKEYTLEEIKKEQKKDLNYVDSNDRNKSLEPKVHAKMLAPHNGGFVSNILLLVSIMLFGVLSFVVSLLFFK